MRAVLQDQNYLFLHFPTVNAPEWPPAVRKFFWANIASRKDCPEPEKDYICVNLHGTTFSGHSTRTTLGNTLRSLFYAWWYIRAAGISNTPWNDSRIHVMASGDDVVILCHPDISHQVK